MTAAERLRDFYDDDPSMWTQNQPQCGRAHCLAAAIALVSTDWREAADLETRVRAWIPGVGIINWNDAPGRTFADIKALVEKVAA